MELKTLRVSECYESETNPRGRDFAGKQFDELVASVKEKGVMMPVLARPRSDGKGYEIVAGNRRLRAAKEVGLKEIPAKVDPDMDDSQAREAQIVENLQRADVHPLEEGEAYRRLIEESELSVSDVAVRVGKTEAYVKGRLFLTNLTDQTAKAYRTGEIPDTFAVVIAKLAPAAQNATLKHLKESYGDVSLDSLKDFIVREFSNPLGYQPWITFGLAGVVGPCKECPPNREDLFGKQKDGQCTDLKCWRRKMAAFIAWKKEQEPDLALVTKSYGKPETPWAISRSDYEMLGSKKEHCDFAQKALVVEGEDIGTTVWICAAKECKDHHAERTDYAKSPKEKEKRKKEREKEVAKEAKFNATVTAALEKVKWPLHPEMLDTLLDIALADTGTSFLMPICKRHALKADKTKEGRDYKAPLRRLADEGGKDGKLRMLFELHLPTYGVYGDDKALAKTVAKL